MLQKIQHQSSVIVSIHGRNDHPNLAQFPKARTMQALHRGAVALGNKIEFLKVETKRKIANYDLTPAHMIAWTVI